MDPYELAVWRENVINGLTQPGEKRLTADENKQEPRRGKELEREISREEKPLMEAATLLVLSKKPRRFSGNALFPPCSHSARTRSAVNCLERASFADMPPARIVPPLADEGVYLASE